MRGLRLTRQFLLCLRKEGKRWTVLNYTRPALSACTAVGSPMRVREPLFRP